MLFLFADVRTGYMVVFTGKTKDSLLEAFKQAVAHFKRWGHEVKSFRSDAETVLKDGKMGSYLQENIRSVLTLPCSICPKIPTNDFITNVMICTVTLPQTSRRSSV